MTRDEWLAVAIAVADDPGIAPIQLQQSLFLFNLKREKDSGPDFYQFEPHDYGSAAKEAEGPFSKALYADLDALVDEGLVSKTWQPGEACSLFRPTEAGHAWVKDLRRQAKDDVSPVKRSFCSLVKYRIRLTFPEAFPGVANQRTQEEFDQPALARLDLHAHGHSGQQGRRPPIHDDGRPIQASPGRVDEPGLVHLHGVPGNDENPSRHSSVCREGKGVDLDLHRLAGADEAHVLVLDPRFYLDGMIVRHDYHQLLRRRDHSTERMYGHLLNHASDR